MINLPLNIDFKDKIVVVTGAGGLIWQGRLLKVVQRLPL